jgi:hypothetical protein
MPVEFWEENNMRLKNIAWGVVAVLLLSSSLLLAADAENADRVFMPEGYPPLSQEDPREDSEEAESRLMKIMREIAPKRRERAGSKAPFMVMEDVQDLYQFVREYNNCEAALTARLFFGALIQREARYVNFVEARSIFEDIMAARPDTWQATMAELALLGEAVRQSRVKEGHAASPVHEERRAALIRALPVCKRLDLETKELTVFYRRWNSRTGQGRTYPVKLNALAHINAKLGYIDEARENYLEVIASFPESIQAGRAKNALKNLGKEIPGSSMYNEIAARIAANQRREESGLTEPSVPDKTEQQGDENEGETSLSDVGSQRSEETPEHADVKPVEKESSTGNKLPVLLLLAVSGVGMLWFWRRKLK